jgi:hypothetical protein
MRVHSSKQHKEWVRNGYGGTTDDRGTLRDRGVKRSGFLIRFNEMAESAGVIRDRSSEVSFWVDWKDSQDHY